MGKAWLGYLGSFFVLLAGILMIVGERPVMGSVMILLSIAGAIIKYILMKKMSPRDSENKKSQDI